jgi:glucose-1-phosphate cytidylyltransferase
VDTGLHSNIGQRLLRVRKYLEGEQMFLANYSDGLSDLDLGAHIDHFKARDAIASFVSVRSSQSFHAVRADADGVVTNVGVMPDQQLWINGGYFVLRTQIFDYIREGEELVEQPFARLVGERKLLTLPWQGFWQCMDTFKDKIGFDRMEARGTCPWMLWNKDLSHKPAP